MLGKNRASGKRAEMMPELAHPEPRLAFEIWARQTETDCPRFFENLRNILGNPCVSQMAHFCYLIAAKGRPNFG